jgi:hypothetical protein
VTKPRPEERRRQPRLTKPNREKFLEALALGWSVTHAAGLAGRSRQRFYELREADEAFAEAWSQAIDAGTDVLEDEAKRRAVDGWDEPIYQRGDLVGHVRRYSDNLLALLLRARRPAIYRENAGIELKTPAVFVLDSSFGRERDIEAPQVKPPLPLPSGEGRDV